MNRKQRRAALRGKGPLAGRICEHGHLKKTDGNGDPMCPHGCGFRTGGMVTYEELHAYGSASGQ